MTRQHALDKYGNLIPIFTIAFSTMGCTIRSVFKRELAPILKSRAEGFPVLSLTGPRQSGKTTLVRQAFPDYAYANLENLDVMAAATEDPRRFLAQHRETGIIIDEAQRAPELFSYLQGIVDERPSLGHYVLTGSQNFLLLEKISQTLAGRTAILHLLPFSQAEMESSGLLTTDLDTCLFQGGYPPLFDRPVSASDFFPSYIETYLERDVRSMKNIGNLSLFRRFLALCAGRVGQLLNMSALGNELGVDHKTIASWISVLEASFVVYLLAPYHRNWNKRVVKQRKLYFHDTGLLCSLLGLRRPEDLRDHHLRGALFENHVISEYMKTTINAGERPRGYFWRDHSGHEVDLLIENGPQLQAVEIKSGSTLHPSFFDGLKWFANATGLSPDHCTLVYGGVESQQRQAGRVISWRDLHHSLPLST